MRGRYRKWRRPATDFPDRKHATNVADAVHDARIKAEEKDRAFYDALLKGEQCLATNMEDQDPGNAPSAQG